VEIKRTNDEFDALMKSRDSQEAAKTALRMKQVRAEIDKCVSSMIDRMDALILINGETVYTPFVNELNQRMVRFNTTLAIRKGRKTKDTKEEEETPTK
jgi:butyrate kinase